MEDSLVYLDDARDPEKAGTHVIILGVGRYEHGKGQPARSPVGGDLAQLTSPPVSARKLADWFIDSFQNPQKPLMSVSLLISEKTPSTYVPPRPSGAAQAVPPPATLANVKKAAAAWAERVGKNQDNLAVFYFCGHGSSLGHQAALLLEDFGEPGSEFEGAVDLEVLRGTMRNSPAIQQAFLLDCCRTDADDFYRHEVSIGSRIVSLVPFQRGHERSPQQFVLFPTIDGETAFGIRDGVSVFTSSLIDALSFAAADGQTGVWRTTTAGLHSAVDQLVRYRLPANLIQRTKPNALDATSFDFNLIDEPKVTRSYVTISDLEHWGAVRFVCRHESDDFPPVGRQSSETDSATCCVFELQEGKWEFTGELPASPPEIAAEKRTLRLPVAYVRLEVNP